MGEGRCLTSYVSNRQTNDYIMMKNGIRFQDNFAYREFLQKAGVRALRLPTPDAACARPVPMGTSALKNGNLNF